MVVNPKQGDERSYHWYHKQTGILAVTAFTGTMIGSIFAV
jgi:hypothetical protein